MRINTKCYEEFEIFMESIHDIEVVNYIEKVFPSKEILFVEGQVAVLAECYEDAYLAALDNQVL